MDKALISAAFPYEWVMSTWRHLGIIIPTVLTKLSQVNFQPLVEELCGKLNSWCKVVLSWPDRVYLVKSFIFPKCLYLFHTLPVWIPRSTLNKWQQILADFLWAYKRHRIAAPKMMRPTSLGGLNIPNLALYYEAAHLAQALKILGSTDLAPEGWQDFETSFVAPLSLFTAFWSVPKLRPSALQDNCLLRPL